MAKIQKSIQTYHSIIMKDINASARIVVEGLEDKTYITRIIDWENKNITFHAPLVLGDYVRLLRDKSYPFIIVTKACIYTTSVKILAFKKNKQGHFYYTALIDSVLERNQQRKYFRLEWVNDFTYRTQHDNKLRKARTLDISAGGLLMASNHSVSRNDSIHIEITLLDQDFILDGIVLESLGKNHTDLYISRVQFHELSRNTENLLSQVIMRRQRDMLR